MKKDRKCSKKELIIFIFAIACCGLLSLWAATTSYRMEPGYNWDSDFGRDLLYMLEIGKGNHTLLGPQLNLSGLRMGPYSFYLFTPFLYISNFDYRSVIYANSFFFLVSLSIVFIYTKRKWGAMTSALSILWLVTTPYFLLSTRTPGNAFSYLPMLLVLLTSFLEEKKTTHIKQGLFGIINGIIIHFHPINILISLPLHLASIITAKKESIKDKMSQILIIIFSIIIVSTPLILFELKHKFVILKHLFDPERSKTGSIVTGSLIEHINSFIAQTSVHTPLTILGLVLLCLYLLKNNSEKKYVWFFYISMLYLLFLFTFQLTTFHYFIPVILFLQLFVVSLIKKSKWKYAILLILIGINMLNFPTHLYQPARSLRETEKKVNQLVASDILPKENLNIMLFNETSLSKVGYEYRFLLKKNGYKIDHEQQYNQSQYLLVVVEGMKANPEQDDSWESSQFGKKKLVSIYELDNTAFYLYEKQ